MADIILIKETIRDLSYIHLEGELSQDDNGMITGVFDIDTSDGKPPLKWALVINPSYPFKVNGQDSIKFINKDLIDYEHIMETGLLCSHSLSYPNERQQLIADFNHLKEWVEKYYIPGAKDEHYDHLVVNHLPVEKFYYTFQFSDVKCDLKAGDYGRISLRELFQGLSIFRVNTRNFCFQSIKSDKNYNAQECFFKWNSQNYINSGNGIYCIISKQPATYDKFIIKGYKQLNEFLDKGQISFIYNAIKFNNKNLVIDGYIPLFLGYRIPYGELHWQALMVPAKKIPMVSFKEKDSSSSKTIWSGEFKEGTIHWAETFNSSYNHFFGRGAYDSSITDKKILLLGIGAIGSMIAVTLARCGMRNLAIFDFDSKLPENICRSEYNFFTGIDLKSRELRSRLFFISPYVNCDIEINLDNDIKTCFSEQKKKEEVETKLNGYDFIFDCTTDNSLMFCLEKLELKARVINISITNHAKELVCAFSPDIKTYVETIYTKMLHNDTTDMFYPTGCWDPTFKASYNDIATMVQYAMKHIVKMLTGEENLTNFYISEDNNGLTIHRL